ncbi:MAG: DUF1624 domain-containing protein [Acidobacteria bacterium]|nr:DUF1624 domain-containing protein [Acidobacteriota bacterium]
MKERPRHAGRVIFIDLARALAVVLMISGHTSSALLSTSYRSSEWFNVWQFQRGLTSALFLLLSGFAFSIATSRHWPSHVNPSAAVVKRLRRFGLFVLLGYGLHFPVGHFSQLAEASDTQWRNFLAVDVLQLIGVTFVLIQLLVMVVRTRRMFTVAAFTLAAFLVVAAPAVWRTDWSGTLPLFLSSYLSSSTGSLFPIFPWAAFVLLGAGIGQLFAQWGTASLRTFANWGMLLPGGVLVAVASNMSIGPTGAAGVDDWSWIPGQLLLRSGICLVILGIVAHISHRIGQLPHVFGAVAQESLVVYFVHLCVVYGSVWNRGLHQSYGEALSLPVTLLFVAAVVVPMIALAWQWNNLKHTRPQAARWVSIAVGTVLVVRLL